MKVAIMQPYFLPYIGYYQLIASVDAFVVYDNIKYTKKGWVNRNRLLRDGADFMFSLPLKKGSDGLDVIQRELAVDFDRGKLLNQFRGAYSKAPYFREIQALLEDVVNHPDSNLFGFLRHAISRTCAYIGIDTPIIVSSEIDIDHGLKAQDKVIALCHALGADVYINPVGGMALYNSVAFKKAGVDLRFLQARPVEYVQFSAPFVPWLSIIDVLMFNAPEKVSELIRGGYDLI